MFQVDRYTQLVGGERNSEEFLFVLLSFCSYESSQQPWLESDSAVLLNPLKEIKF